MSLEAVVRVVGGGQVLLRVGEDQVLPADVLGEGAGVGEEHVARGAVALDLADAVARRDRGRVAVADGVLPAVGVVLAAEARLPRVVPVEQDVVALLAVGPDVRRVPGAVGHLLGGLEDDVVVAAEHHVDALRRLDHLLVDVEAEVREHDDGVDLGPEQVDVELRRLDRAERGDAQAVRLVEDRGQARQVAHADDANAEAVEVLDDEGMNDAAEGRGAGGGRVLEQVVRGEDGEVGPLLELDAEVQRAVVELVVRDQRDVGAHRGERPDLGLAVVEVEDRRALEAVAAVEVQDALGAGPLPADHVGDAGRAADVHDRARGPEAETGVRLGDLEVVREEPRVDVRGVDEGDVHLPLQRRRGRGVGAAGRPGDERGREEGFLERALDGSHQDARNLGSAQGPRQAKCVRQRLRRDDPEPALRKIGLGRGLGLGLGSEGAAHERRGRAHTQADPGLRARRRYGRRPSAQDEQDHARADPDASDREPPDLRRAKARLPL